jgi:hypothetical protein
VQRGEPRPSSFPLFTEVRGIGILRTSPFGDSPTFAFSEFSEFSEVGLPELRLLGSSRRPSAFGIMFLLIAQRIDPTSKPAREGGSQCASSPAS